ncbi:MAG: hypothetical protein AAGD38_13120 [Acidobacteriota bacterium]
MTMQQQRDDLIDQIRDELRLLIRASTATQRDLEDRNGFRPGYLSQVLKGQITLSMRHVIGILLALDVTPTTFFARLEGEPRNLPGWNEIGEKMARYDAALEALAARGILDPKDYASGGGDDGGEDR